MKWPNKQPNLLLAVHIGTTQIQMHTHKHILYPIHHGRLFTMHAYHPNEMEHVTHSTKTWIDCHVQLTTGQQLNGRRKRNGGILEESQQGKNSAGFLGR